MMAKDAAMAVKERLRPKKKAKKDDGPPKPPSKLKLYLKQLGEKISKKLAALRASPWFTFLMFARSEATVLASQFLVFANPSPTYPLTIVTPFFMGSLIALQAIGAPPLYILGFEDSQDLLQGVLAVGYVVLSVQGIQAMFFEADVPSTLPEYTEIPLLAAFSQCIAAIIPLISFAGILQSRWTKEIHTAAVREMKAAGAAVDPQVVPTSKGLKASQLVYMLGS